MTFQEAVRYIEANKDKVAVAMHRKEKEIFIIDFFDYLDEDSELTISYEKEIFPSAGEEAFYDKDECLEEHPYVVDLDFFEVEKETADEARGRDFDYQIEILGLK